jgi:O-antigen ligase
MTSEATPRRFPELPLVALISSIAWAIGTNWLGEWYYPIRGVGWGDLVFILWFMFAMVTPDRRRALVIALWQVRKFILLILAFMTWLLLSTAVNSYWLGAGPTDVFAIVRLLYYCAIVLFAYVAVTEYGYGTLVCGFIIGVGILTLGRLYDAYTAGASSVVLNGLIIIKDPNVIGNMMGIGVLFCSFGILKGYLKLSLLAALLLTVASVTTFSKGTWLMVLAGLLACAVTWVMLFRTTHRSFVRFIPATVLLLGGLCWLVYQYSDLLVDLVSLKLETTTRSETATYRYQFALAALYAMADHPVFGLGFRNYPLVERLYPDVVPEPTENAHNAFLHFGAIGGVPALLLLLLLFAYPFAPLWRVMVAESSRTLSACYTGLVLIILALSGAVQLQLVAQPFFWLFAGLVFGMHGRVLRRPL